MLEKTHIFKLPSGIECEVKGMKGVHQRMLSQQSSNNARVAEDNRFEVIRDLVVRIGSNDHFSLDILKSMPSCDIKCMLVNIRQLTFKFPTEFAFQWKYKDNDGRRQTLDETIDLSDCFKITTVKRLDIEGNLIDGNYSEIEDIERSITVQLPETEIDVTFELLNFKGEKIAGSGKRSDLSTHNQIYAYKPTTVEKFDNGENIVKRLELDDLPAIDIEFLRTKIKEFNGQVDTEIMFDHPNSEAFSQGGDDFIIKDLLSLSAFFYPSGVL